MSVPLNEVLVPGAQPIGSGGGALPDQFGRYRILRTLAFGGMAQILLAEDVRVHRLVVIKRILPHYASNPEFVQFFIHEGRLGQRLRHHNLVETLEAGQVGDACYIALEYLRGQPCIELLRAAARARVELPLGVAVRIVADAARGLHYAHMACDNEGKPLGVVHRDVTPHNLYLCEDGTTKVLDFGIAKAASQLHHTRTGTIKGKFAYLAPEQIRGESIDRRVDVFALGIVLHELLTLRPLFRGANDAETLNRVLGMEVPAPDHVRPGLPPGLGAVALRALQRDRERRLPSAEALADSIEAVAEAEGIDTSPKRVAELLAELCPADDVSPSEPSTSGDSDKVSLAAGARSAVDSDPIEIEDDAPPTSVSRPGALPPPHAHLEGQRHPQAVPALQLPEHEPDSVRYRRLAAQIALLVIGVTILALGATHMGSCAGRVANLRAARSAQPPKTAPAESSAPPPPAVQQRSGKEAAPLKARPAAPPPLGQPERVATPDSDLVPAGASSNEALLRVQLEGPATFVVDGRTEHVGSDGLLHLTPGHHRVLVSAPTLAFPRSLEVDLRARESATRVVPRGHGVLRIAVTPWAEVTIDGKLVGTTPLQPLELLEGAHSVALKNGDLGIVAKRRLVVSPNKETLFKLDLFGEKK